MPSRTPLAMMDDSIYKQAEKALNKSNEHLLDFIDALPQMAWIGRPDGKIAYFNKAWYEFTGMKTGQTEGWVNVIHPEDCSQVIEGWNKALQAGDYHLESRIRNSKDSSYRWFLEQAMPIRDDNGKIKIWVGTYTDINDEKQDLEPL